MQRFTNFFAFFVAALLAVSAAHALVPTQAFFDGFGDGDRNNDGSITLYDTDVNYNGNLDFFEISTPLDATDVGLQWFSSRGFTGAPFLEPKARLQILDDSTGDSFSPGLQSGYALSYEAKGRGGSAVGAFPQSIEIGPNVGDKVVASLDIRVWTEAFNDNAFEPPQSADLHWGLFQDSDNQFGQSASAGVLGTNVVWGHDPAAGENDGEWRDSSPGPVGDKGIWSLIPVGATGPGGTFADPTRARIRYENNTSRFLEGTSSTTGGDLATVASVPFDGPGGAIFVPQLTGHALSMEFIRTADSIEVVSKIDDVEILRDFVDLSKPDAQLLGPAPVSFDYIALRNTGEQDFDFIIDNVSIESIPVPEPATIALLALAVLGLPHRCRK